MFRLFLRADQRTKGLSPDKIVGAIEFHCCGKKCFEVIELKVCLISSDDIVASSHVVR